VREPFSCFSHLLGAIVFAILGFFMVRRGTRPAHVASLAVLAVSSVLLLSLSSFYHMLWPGAGRELMRRLDIAAVFVLIGGSMTPVHVILFRGFNRWGPLVLVWTTAVAGIVLRMFIYTELSLVAGTSIFLIFGWGGAITGFVLWRRYGWVFMQSFVLGGLAYTFGAIVIGLHWPVLIDGIIGPHDIWHIAVLSGLGFHWWFIWQFAHQLEPPI